MHVLCWLRGGGFFSFDKNELIFIHLDASVSCIDICLFLSSYDILLSWYVPSFYWTKFEWKVWRIRGIFDFKFGIVFLFICLFFVELWKNNHEILKRCLKKWRYFLELIQPPREVDINIKNKGYENLEFQYFQWSFRIFTKQSNENFWIWKELQNLDLMENKDLHFKITIWKIYSDYHFLILEWKTFSFFTSL